MVLSVNGRAVGGNPNTLTSVIEDHPGVPLVVVVERGGQRKTLTVTPVNGRTHHEAGALVPKGSAPYGIIGVKVWVFKGEVLQRRNRRPQLSGV